MALHKLMLESKTHLLSLEMPNICPRVGEGDRQPRLYAAYKNKTKQNFGNTSESYGVQRRVFRQLSSILPHLNYK